MDPSLDAQSLPTCPTCGEPFATEVIAGLPAQWCPRCAVLCAGADDLEKLAQALRRKAGPPRRIRALLPVASKEAGVSVGGACGACGEKLYLQDANAWVVCGGCGRRYVPAAELPILVNDPGLAHRRPLDMPFKLTEAGRKADQRAFLAGGLFVVGLAVVAFLFAADRWDSAKPLLLQLSNRHGGPVTGVQLLLAGVMLLGLAGGLFVKAANPEDWWKENAGPTDEYRDRDGRGY